MLCAQNVFVSARPLCAQNVFVSAGHDLTVSQKSGEFSLDIMMLGVKSI